MANDRSIAVYELGIQPVEFRIDPEHQTLWATQADMAAAFGIDQSVISRHISGIFQDEELEPENSMQKLHSAGSKKPVNHYNLDVVIAVGYRVSSKQGTLFRKWATKVLAGYASGGYALDVHRLEHDPVALANLGAQIRSIRQSEQVAYQKVRDVFKASASDYDKDSEQARRFFAMAQDKFHYAVTRRTSAETILDRASAEKPNMGLTTFSGETPSTADVTIGKNYLTAEELAFLENICEQFLLFCETQAMRGKQMTMEEISFRLNTILQANDYPVLFEYQSASRDKANTFARAELDKYRRALAASTDGR